MIRYEFRIIGWRWQCCHYLSLLPARGRNLGVLCLTFSARHSFRHLSFLYVKMQVSYYLSIKKIMTSLLLAVFYIFTATSSIYYVFLISGRSLAVEQSFGRRMNIKVKNVKDTLLKADLDSFLTKMNNILTIYNSAKSMSK